MLAFGLAHERHPGGVPTAVATSSEAPFTEFSLGRAGLLGAFQAIVTGDQIEHDKPAPDIYLQAAKQLGVEPDRCVALEDSEAGAVTTSGAGMVTLLVPDWVPPSSTARRAADQVVASLVEAHAFVAARLLASSRGCILILRVQDDLRARVHTVG